MPLPSAPYCREAGSGPGIVCLHANASTSGQWRALMELLAPQFHVLAPDLYGAGQSPEWPSDRVIALRDEVELIEPVLARAGTPFTLVAHSYGAAVALIAALAQPSRVRALALYEPTLFSLVDAASLPPNDTDGIRMVAHDAGAALDAGDTQAAARRFIDYWMGAGSFDAMPASRQPAVAASVVNVRRWAHALFTEPTPLAAFRALEVPVLYMTGRHSPASSLAVARLLTATLPRVACVTFDQLGHMGPVTHAEPVNTVITRFVARA